jgi:large subunit ribosomal protein L35Ae
MSEIKGIVLYYRNGPKTQRSKERIISFYGVNSVKEAGSLIGKKISWSIEKKKCIGKILSFHGKKGLLVARFRKGLPGKAMGTLVEICG